MRLSSVTHHQKDFTDPHITPSLSHPHHLTLTTSPSLKEISTPTLHLAITVRVEPSCPMQSVLVDDTHGALVPDAVLLEKHGVHYRASVRIPHPGEIRMGIRRHI